MADDPGPTRKVNTWPSHTSNKRRSFRSAATVFVRLISTRPFGWRDTQGFVAAGCSIPKVIGFNFRAAIIINGRGRGNTLSLRCGTKTIFTRAAELPADQFGTVALPAHSQPESPHLRGRRPHQRSRIIRLGLAALRGESHTGFNPAHLAREAVGHRPVERPTQAVRRATIASPSFAATRLPIALRVPRFSNKRAI